MGFKYSFNTLVQYGRESIDDSIKRVAACGYDGVEIPGFYDLYEQSGHIKELCGDLGLNASSICSFFGDGMILSHPDENVRKNTIDYMKRTADFAAEVGAPVAIVYPGQFGKPIPLAGYEDEKRWGVDGIREIAEYAEPLGVSLCIEAWNRYDSHLINTLEQAVDWAQKTGMKNVGVQGDTFHLQFEEADQIKAIKEAGDKLIHMHFSENTRSAPGTGSKDFKPILKALKAIDYKGYITFEILPPAYDFNHYMDTHDCSAFFDEYTELSLKTLRKAESELE